MPRTTRRTAMSVRALCATSGIVVALTASPAHAQFGKLKKLGADAVKEAAKDKLGADKPKDAAAAPAASASTSAKKPAAAPVLTAEKVGLIVSSLTPLLKDAQRRDDASRAMAAWVARKEANDACMRQATEKVDQASIVANAMKNAERTTALQKQAEAASSRMAAVAEAGDTRKLLFLQDTVNVLTVRMSAVSMGITCPVDYTPSAILEEQWSARARQSAGASNGEDGAGTADPGKVVTSAMSQYEYGLLRERMALWALLQENPALRGAGAQGVFTAEENAALAAHAADIKKMTPLFKSQSLLWKTWSDLKSW